MPLNFAKIKALRLKLGLTMEEAARAAGMTGKGNWYSVESGRTPNLTIEKLERIARVLNVQPAELLKAE